MKSNIITLLGSVFLVVILAACGGGGSGDSSGGGGVVETEAPYVISTNPVLNSTGEDTNRAITATFNEDIDPATITSNSFLVDNATGGIITGSVTYDAASRTAIFRSDVYLATSTTYVATITTDIEDLAGNTLIEDYTWQFTTAAPPEINAIDTTPPVVLSRFPTPNATSVVLNAAISVTFNEPIDPSTINSNALTLNGTNSVSGTVSYVGTTALFKPAANLVAGTVYTVTIAATIKDLAGNALEAPVVWNFTTGSQIDVQGPQVLSTFPLNGAVNVPTDSLLVVNFDEAIKPFEFGTIDGRPVNATFNATYTTVTMKPTAGLLPGSPYDGIIFVEDQAGNLMDEKFTLKFTTAP